MKTTLYDFVESLKKAKTLKELKLALKSFLAEYEINTFAFTYYAYYPNSLNKTKYDFSTENLKNWHEHYINEGYEDVDTTLDVVYQTTLPTFWTLTQQLRQAKSKRERLMRTDSIKFGIVQGLSIPIHGPQEDFAILVIMQMNGEHCLRHYEKLQYDWFTAAYFFYTYLQKALLHSQAATPKFNLSSREIQILTLLARKCSLAEIAKNLFLTERTINYHIQRLNKKLGCSNKYQSIAKAIKEKLIIQ